MKLTSESFADMGRIPGRCAFAVPDAKSQARLSDNRNPQLAWNDPLLHHCVLAAIEGHVLDSAMLTGVCSLNLSVKH